jgi:hypothetical protein
VPRKYHRPPTATKRRKGRKSIPYEFGEAPPEDVAEQVISSPEEGDEAEGWEEEDITSNEGTAAVAVAERPRTRRSTVMERDEHGKQERHVRRDYSYVRGEVIRIVVIGGFLVIALIITSIFR